MRTKFVSTQTMALKLITHCLTELNKTDQIR